MSELSLDYLVRYPKKNVENPPLMIMLHGYGSNEQDLFSFADELADELLIISAKAPLTLGMGSYAWYSIRFSEDSANFSDTTEAKSSLEKIDTFISEVKKEFKVNTNNIFLLGFSQGTILSIAYALNYPDKVQHVVALSGYVNQQLLQDGFKENNFNNLDLFVSHGSEDQVIPVIWARKTPDFLNALGIENSYKEYPVGHGVAPQNFYDFQKWVQERL